MSFLKWSRSRKWSESLSSHDSNVDQGLRGFIYEDGSWIALSPTTHQGNHIWWTMIANIEFESSDLDRTERWLWNNHAKSNDDGALDEQKIIDDWKAFCEMHDDRCISMDERLADLEREAATYRTILSHTENKIKEVIKFLNRWESCMEAQRGLSFNMRASATVSIANKTISEIMEMVADGFFESDIKTPLPPLPPLPELKEPDVAHQLDDEVPF